MPENETFLLDARSASRWRPVGERMDRGQPPAELFPEIQDNFFSSCKRVWRQWKARGIDPGQLFAAALNDPMALRDLIKQSSNDPNARLLRDVAAELQDADMERLIFGFLNAAWDEVEGQLQINRRENAQSLEFRGQIQRMLNRIVTSLISNPSRFPNRPSRNELTLDLDTQLRESLL
jgi:hypothetical protein